MASTEEKRSLVRLIVYSAVLVLLIILVGIALYYTLYVYHIVPFSLELVSKLAVALALGYVAIEFIGREIRSLSVRVFGERRGDMVLVVYRFVTYVLLALILLAIAGISGTALLAGGTFAGLVLGLAGQTVLSNIIAGIMLILSRPYEVEDRITFVTWQYGLIVPSYPPKLFSHESLMPGYSGRILDIGLLYSEIKLDDGPTMKVPNSVMVVAAIVSHELKERWVRTKYEIPVAIDPKQLIPALTEIVKKNEWVSKPETVSVLVNAVTSTIYIVSIDALCSGSFEEPPRSSILLDVMEVVKRMRISIP